MKFYWTILILVSLPLFGAAEPAAPCEGSVLERRLALVKLGELAEAYIAAQDALPDLCQQELQAIKDALPERLKTAQVCGSSEEGMVYYSCELSTTISDKLGSFTQVMETCRYYFKDQSLACDNRSTVTTVEGEQAQAD